MVQTTDAIAAEHHAIVGGRSRTFGSAEAKFEALAEEWEESTAALSRLDVNHTAYHQVIGMGPPVVPMLLDRLRGGDTDWIYALKCITGHEAETPDMVGDHDRVIAAWLDWGATRGSRVGQF